MTWFTKKKSEEEKELEQKKWIEYRKSIYDRYNKAFESYYNKLCYSSTYQKLFIPKRLVFDEKTLHIILEYVSKETPAEHITQKIIDDSIHEDFLKNTRINYLTLFLDPLEKMGYKVVKNE